jgi:ABC-2 type transport system permease protein
MGFVSLLGALMVIGPSIAFYFGGYSIVSGGRLAWLALPFWAIFIFWQIFPIFAAGFGSSFEFRTLLRFPFNASAFYLIGLAYGLSDFPSIASVCWLLAMTAGATVAQASILPIMLVVLLLFILLNVTIERLIGSWLERLLARRRTRELFFGLFVLAMLSMQFIGPMQSRYLRKGNPAALLALVKYLSPFPPSLCARVIAGAVRHDFADIALGLSGLVAFVAFFTALLWQRFAAQYRGEELSEAAAPSGARAARAMRAPAAIVSKHEGLEAAFEGKGVSRLLSPIVKAVVRKEFLYVARNGFAFFLLVLPPAQILIFSSQFHGRNAFFKRVNTEILFPAMMAYTILVLIAPAYNAFAYEGRGIQTYFTSPLTFADIFTGKNIVSATLIAGEVLICGAVLTWRIGLPSTPTLLATFLGLIFMVVGQLPVANWASLNFPRKLEFGSMRSQRNSGIAVWIMFGMQIVMGAISALVLTTGRWTGNLWLAPEGFVLLVAIACSAYLSSLQPLAEVAEKKKETLIEALCR